MRIIDLSVALKAGIASDPPSMLPKIEYLDHKQGAQDFAMLFSGLKAEQLPMTHEIAENLFVAISTDTGSFQYPNTSARTFEIAAELIRAGANVGQLSQQTYENYPRRRIELLRALLDVMIGVPKMARKTMNTMGIAIQGTSSLAV